MPKAPAINISSYLILLLAASLITASCQRGPEVINDLSDTSLQVVDQDSNRVDFPQDFRGEYLIVGFIYTHCPDICPVISAKLSNISKQLEDKADVKFIQITFDPERDTPSVLKKYMQNFKQEQPSFTSLTGDTDTIDSLLNRMDITAKVAGNKNGHPDEESYSINHTNRILIMDEKGRVRFEYPGSVVNEDHVIDDLNVLR